MKRARIARYRWTCDECKHEILPGHIYLHETSRTQGTQSFRSRRTCADCVNGTAAVLRYMIGERLVDDRSSEGWNHACNSILNHLAKPEHMRAFRLELRQRDEQPDSV